MSDEPKSEAEAVVVNPANVPMKPRGGLVDRLTRAAQEAALAAERRERSTPTPDEAESAARGYRHRALFHDEEEPGRDR